MIKYIKITNNVNESISIDMQDPKSSGFFIRSIDGLGPSKASLNFKQLATSDGSVLNSSKISNRNIVISLGFYTDEKTNEKIEDIRLRTYKYFPIKKQIRFEIETDNRHVYIDGVVESNSPDIFSNSEGCSISIICADPFFRSMKYMDNQPIYFFGTDPLFEFPFENNRLDYPMLLMGEIRDRVTSRDLIYYGDANTGVTININAKGTIRGIEIYNLTNNQVMRIDDTILENIVPYGISNGDIITINTNRGYKSAILNRYGVKYNILNALGMAVQWIQVNKGINTFVYNCSNGLTNLEFSIQAIALLEGV